MKKNTESATSPHKQKKSNCNFAAPKNAIRVRMYRVGFGDCFLISVPVEGKTEHILIDCGVHSGGDIGTMEDVVKNIAEETGQRLALVIATHAHRDHISGFGAFNEIFKQFVIGQVWMPWTENQQDSMAIKLRKKHLALVNAITTHLNAHPIDKKDVMEAIQAALDNCKGNQATLAFLNNGINKGKVEYVKAGGYYYHVAGIPGLSAQILAPPRDEEFLARMNPPASEHFLRLDENSGDTGSTGIIPFSHKWYVNDDELNEYPYYATVDEKEKNRLAEAATSAVEMAFTLSRIINNTSIVVLFTYKGKSLLFPGDAQYGNWQSWMNGRDRMLANVNFLKVAHHGSENATPRSALERLPDKSFVAMIPTQDKPFKSIPHRKLMQEIEKRALGAVRSDSISITKAPIGPDSPLPMGFSKGALWIDYDLPL